MVNKEKLRLRFQLSTFFVLLAAMLFAGLYPFNFFPLNRVRWIQDEHGLYFEGAGIIYTEKNKSIYLKKAVSIELLLKERRGSKNWGPKEIFSFYDGAGSPPLLVGQWDGHIFIYSRFEKNEGHQWYRLFRTKQRFPRGKAHLVTVTYDESEKAIYIDGQLSNRKNVEVNDRAHIEFSEGFILGNSPRGKNGWWGEIKGLAVYNRILLPDEILKHSIKIFQKGVSSLAETPGCLALYPFNEGEGNTVKSILSKPIPFYIPVRLNALALTMLSLPYKDMKFYGFNKIDFQKNILFFVPFGILLTAIILKKYVACYFPTFLIVPLAGGILSFIIEYLQLFLPTRYTGMADIFGNILGSGFGMLVTFIVLKYKNSL
jgi:glycopeptide antibiotics resistance protein